MRRTLVINGFMASGKSSVGALVAARAGREFIDLDARIEEIAGASVTELFRTRGEARFRALERQELERILGQTRLSSEPPVVAVGGGALLARDLRLRVLDEAVVVTLEASPHELLRRAQAGRAAPEGRPLLDAADPLARIRELVEARSSAYAEAHARLATDDVPPAEVCERVLAVWHRSPIAVAANDRSYAVDVGNGLVESRLAELVSRAPVLLLVSDDNIHPLHGQRLETALAGSQALRTAVILQHGERHKTLGACERIWQQALACGADRSSVFVALGGGVVCDVTGFAAASWMRGVRWVSVPTTLLAMVDAAVGGKTGVDFGTAKNAVGAFWQPFGVLCDVALSATEPRRGYTSALAEVVKTAIIGDPDLFDLLEANAQAVRSRDSDLVRDMVERCVRVKARIVSLDEREGGPRARLNLGHTLGHALESQGGYVALTHGEAVSLGLVAALGIGEKLGLTDAELHTRTLALLGELGLPTDLAAQPLQAASALIAQDKKRAGSRLKFVVARRMGQVETVDLGLDELRNLAQSLS